MNLEAHVAIAWMLTHSPDSAQAFELVPRDRAKRSQPDENHLRFLIDPDWRRRRGGWYNIVGMKNETVESPSAENLLLTDASGEVDLEQIRYNLKLTPGERLDQNDRWAEFAAALRAGGAEFYARSDSNG